VLFFCFCLANVLVCSCARDPQYVARPFRWRFYNWWAPSSFRWLLEGWKVQIQNRECCKPLF
jgi:hypothetical protein